MVFTRRASAAVVLLVSTALVLACQSGLPTAMRPSEARVCTMGGLGGVLHGSPTDPRLAWLVNDAGGRTDLLWPWGFTVRFAPDLEVVARDGSVVGRHLKRIELGGSSSETEFQICWVAGKVWSGLEQFGPP